MSSSPAWFALLWVAGLALLAVPFVPLWREWAHPTDSAPLAVSPRSDNDALFFARQLREAVARGAREVEVVPGGLRHAGPLVRPGAPLYVEGNVDAGERSRLHAVLATGNLRLGAASEVSQWIHADGRLRLGTGSVVLRRATAGRSIRLAAGCSFERLAAPLLLFGGDRVRTHPAPPLETAPMDYSAIPRSRRRTASLFRVSGDCVLPPDSHYEGSLVVTGTLSIGAGTTIRGDLKARQGVLVGERCAILGAISSECGIEVRAGAFVKGPVISESDVVLGAGVFVGTLGQPTTVTAENIMVEAGAVAHGAVWAREAGIVWVGA